jgi:hypothetical protein
MTVYPAAMTISFSAPSTVTPDGVLRLHHHQGQLWQWLQRPCVPHCRRRPEVERDDLTMAGGSTTAGLVLGIKDTLYITTTPGSLTGKISSPLVSSAGLGLPPALARLIGALYPGDHSQPPPDNTETARTQFNSGDCYPLNYHVPGRPFA